MLIKYAIFVIDCIMGIPMIIQDNDDETPNRIKILLKINLNCLLLSKLLYISNVCTNQPSLTNQTYL
jgi:hypothetical protein